MIRHNISYSLSPPSGFPTLVWNWQQLAFNLFNLIIRNSWNITFPIPLQDLLIPDQQNRPETFPQSPDFQKPELKPESGTDHDGEWRSGLAPGFRPGLNLVCPAAETKPETITSVSPPSPPPPTSVFHSLPFLHGLQMSWDGDICIWNDNELKIMWMDLLLLRLFLQKLETCTAPCLLLFSLSFPFPCLFLSIGDLRISNEAGNWPIRKRQAWAFLPAT